MIEAEAVVAAGTLKTTCSRDDLLRGLGIVSRGVSTRTTVQILAGILLDATGRLLLDIARLLPETEVSVEHRLEEAVVEVRCGSASYCLHTYNPEDFPRLP